MTDETTQPQTERIIRSVTQDRVVANDLFSNRSELT